MASRDTGYLGNPQLKGSDTPIEWTPDLQAEFIKCANDPIYFAEKYIMIVHVDRGLIPIKLYDYQKDIINAITTGRRVAVNTSRQAGKTTTAAAVILHYILFNKHKLVALLANKGDAAREILDRIKLSFEALPKWLQQGVKEWNKGSIQLENGCKVIAAASSSSAIRGKSVALLYIDECAFLENWDEFFTSVYPTISSGKKTKILLTSTPNSMNHFAKICKEAQEPKDSENYNGYDYIEVKWDKIPGRDAAWMQDTLAAMSFDMEKFQQEFECSFIGSVGTLISGVRLKEMSFDRPIAEQDGLRQYAKPVRDRIYVLMADVSRGKGLDYSAFSIIDVTEMPYQQVCTFRSNTVGAVDYASIIYRMATSYNNAYILLELNDLGAQVSDTLFMELGYEEMLFTENAGRSGKRISGGFGKKVDRGITMSTGVKATGCALLKMLIEQKQLHIRDQETIKEFYHFSRKGNSYEAEPGFHDDMVMGLVIFAWLSGQMFFREITDINTLAHLKEKTEEQLDDELLPFGFISDGRDDELPPGWEPIGSW